MKNVMRVAWAVVFSLVFVVIVGCTTTNRQTGAISWQEVISAVKHQTNSINILAFYKANLSKMTPAANLRINSSKIIKIGFVVVYKDREEQIEMVFLDEKRPLKIIHTVLLQENSRLY